MNIDNIHFISFDLDGTLLNHKKEITSYSIEIIMRLQEKGYVIILNSGRFYHELKQYIEQLHLHEYGGYVICSNGCILYDVTQEKTITFPMLSYMDAHSIFQFAKQEKVMTYLYFNGEYHLYAPLFLRILFYLGRFATWLCYPFLPSSLKQLSTRILHQGIHSYTTLPSFSSIEKMCLLGLPFQLKTVWEKIQEKHSYVHYFEVNRFGIEIVHQRVSKAESVNYICKLHHMTLDNVLAFGDSGNEDRKSVV